MSPLGSEQLAIANVRASTLDIKSIAAEVLNLKLDCQLFNVLNPV